MKYNYKRSSKVQKLAFSKSAALISLYLGKWNKKFSWNNVLTLTALTAENGQTNSNNL